MYKILYKIYFIRIFNGYATVFFEKWFQKIFKVIIPIYFNLSSYFFRYDSKYSINKEKYDSKLIVSLTTFPARINKVWITIETILRQNLKPDAIFLWLYKGDFVQDNKLPKKLTELEKRGLQIWFCDENLMPHIKYFYTLKNFPNATIITIDDDIFYPPDLIERFFIKNRLYPNNIICFRARNIKSIKGIPLPYRSWFNIRENTLPMNELLPLGVGGVLYPPGSLNDQVFCLELIKKFSLTNDDLWLRVMGLLNQTKVVCLGDEYPRFFISLKIKNKTKLQDENMRKGGNDEIFKILIDHFNISDLLN